MRASKRRLRGRSLQENFGTPMALEQRILLSGVDIKNPSSQIGYFNTDVQNKLFIGGGKNDAAQIVSQEFADITGGTWIGVEDIPGLLQALVADKGWGADHGIDGVELMDISESTFTIRIQGNGVSSEIIVLEGQAVENAIADVTYPHIDVKDSKSQLAFFNTDVQNSIFIGGVSATNVSSEFKSLTGGSSIKTSQIEEILRQVVADHGWKNDHGIENVELLDISKDSFTIAISAAGPTRDIIVFSGEAVESAINNIKKGHSDIKDKKSSLSFFHVDSLKDKHFIGGGKSDASRIVSEEFANLVGGTWINGNEILGLLRAVAEPGKNDPGVAGVRLMDLSKDSFTLQIKGAAADSWETIVFTGAIVEAALLELEADFANASA